MKHVIALLALFLSAPGLAQLITPLEGIEQKDWFITNYVDRELDRHDSLDYRCGPRTYDGHRGTDFMIRGFPKMDSGVYVIAAADGRVSFTLDGEFDRSKRWDTGSYGNHIVIEHRDSLTTLYAHLRKNSVLVKAGDYVKQGQRIALVGSSGRSPDPHLHFEVYQDGFIVDPFGRACEAHPPTEALFNFVPKYHNELHYIHSGTTSGRPDYDSVKEWPRMNVFSAADSTITYWVHGLSMPGASTVRTDWYSSRYELWHRETYAWEQYNNYWYYWTSIHGPAVKQLPRGEWRVELWITDKLFDSKKFVVQ